MPAVDLTRGLGLLEAANIVHRQGDFTRAAHFSRTPREANPRSAIDADRFDRFVRALVPFRSSRGALRALACATVGLLDGALAAALPPAKAT